MSFGAQLKSLGCTWKVKGNHWRTQKGRMVWFWVTQGPVPHLPTPFMAQWALLGKTEKGPYPLTSSLLQTKPFHLLLILANDLWCDHNLTISESCQTPEYQRLMKASLSWISQSSLRNSSTFRHHNMLLQPLARRKHRMRSHKRPHQARMKHENQHRELLL